MVFTKRQLSAVIYELQGKSMIRALGNVSQAVNGGISAATVSAVLLLSVLVKSPLSLTLVGLIPLFAGCFLLSKYNANLFDYFGLPEIALLSLMLGYMGVTLLWSDHENGWRLIVEELVRILITVGFMVLFLMLSYESKSIFPADVLYIFIFTAFGVYMLTDVINTRGHVWWWYRRLLTQDGMFYNVNPISWLYSSVIILAMSKFSWFVKIRYGMGLVLFPCVLLVSLSIVYFSQSRSAIVGLAFGSIFYFYLISNMSFFHVFTLSLLAVFVTVAGYKLGYLPQVDQLLLRADSHRIEIYTNALSVISERPIFGHGFGSSSENIFVDGVQMQHFHSLYLNTFFYGGVVGLILLLFLVTLTIKNNYRFRENFGWLSVFIMASMAFIFSANHVVTYPSATFYVYVFPILVMASNRLTFRRVGI